MPFIHAEIEINRSPEEVRKVFLDFARMPEWHTALTITPLLPNKPIAEKGDKIKRTFGSITLTPVVMENTEQAFKWRGSFYGLLYGDHCFRFEPSTKTPGSTTFYQEEKFSGILSFLARPEFSFGKNTKKNFESFNRDIKARVESLQKADETA